MRGERYIYQHDSHMPPWALSYELDYLNRGIWVYATLHSEQIDNARHRKPLDIRAFTPFSVAHQLQSYCEDLGVTFTELDFNQIEWEFSKYF